MTESLHALSGAYVVDALDDAEREAFEAHLPGCVDCQAEVASLREATALMADDATMTPPASLRASVLAGISTVRPLPPEVDRSSVAASPAGAEEPGATVVPMRRRRLKMASLAAAAAVAATIAVGATWHPWEETTTGTLSSADQVLTAGDAQKVSIDFKDGSSASVYRSKSQGRAVILTHDMAAPPAGKVYELWLREAGGDMVPAGLMSRAGDNKVLLDGNAGKATGVGITIEPKGGSKAPTTEPIAVFDLGQGEA